MLDSIRWFDGITEMPIPKNFSDFVGVLNGSDSYVIVDPSAAQEVLKILNEMYNFKFQTENLHTGDFYTWDINSERFVPFDSYLRRLTATYNSLTTVSESFIGQVRRASLCFT